MQHFSASDLQTLVSYELQTGLWNVGEKKKKQNILFRGFKFTVWVSARKCLLLQVIKPHVTLASIPVFLLRARTHLAEAKSKEHTALNKMPLTWVTQWDAEEKHSFGDKVKGVTPKNFATDKTRQIQNSRPSWSCLPQSNPTNHNCTWQLCYLSASL